jgi:hypothetical protein
VPVSDVEELMRGSQWVLRGRIVKVGAAATPDVPASPEHLVVVRVQEMLFGPPGFGDYVGRDISLWTEDTQSLAARGTAVFFTRSWFYGQSVGVVEVGRVSAKESPRVKEEIATAEQSIADRQLGARLSRARLVVLGTVVETGPGSQPERKVETEHNPDWWEAHLEVERVIKGKAPDKVVVTYPASLDELWIDSPKPERAQRAIWILQEDQDEKGWTVLRVPGLTALDPLDVQAPDQLERVVRLAEEQGR